MKYTFGYIDHDKDVQSKFLGPSLASLPEKFDVVTTTSEKCPATNYNTIIDKCNTDYLILIHQDVSFHPNLLRDLDRTISIVPDFGAIGIVGVDGARRYYWSKNDTIYRVMTLDCCFIVINKKHGIKFDDVTFNDFHQYVEDYCAHVSRVHNKPCITMLTNACEARPGMPIGTNVMHHSHTFNKLGACWGKWRECNQKLQMKWPGIVTT
jgi:hypothetical protein